MLTSDAQRKSPWIVFAFVTMLLLAAVPAFADGSLSLLAIAPVGSVSHDVDLQDGFMYVATDAGLTVVDVSTPQAPVIRGRLSAGGNMGIKVRGRYAYLASPTSGLRVVDVGDPDAPRLVATRPAYFAYDIAVKDDVAYVASFAGELYVFDIANPLSPAPLHVFGLPAWRPGGSSGLETLQTYGPSGNAKATGVAVKGNVLAAVDWAFGRLYVYDVSTAASPVFRGTHFAPYILNIDIDPDRDVIYMLSAYSWLSGIYTVPISSLSPDVSTSYLSCPVCGYLPSRVPVAGLDQGGVMLAPGGAYLIYGGGRNNGELNVVDVRDPLAMTYAAPMVPIGPHGVLLANAMGVGIVGDHAYFAAGGLGVQIYHFPGLSGDVGPAAPTVISFALNAGAGSTISRIVALNNTVTGGAVEYRAGESSDLTAAPWLAYDTAPAFSLSAGNGTKLVSFQVRDGDGLESQVKTDTIMLSEPVPAVTTFAINGGATTTTGRTVTLTNTASNGPTEYRASESSTFAGAAWQPYSPAPSFVLSAGNVTKRVYFQARGIAGVSSVRSDTIVLAEPVPVLSSLRIDNGYSTTTSRSVTLDNVASGSPTEYRASESSTFAGAVWKPYSPAPLFELSPGNATKRVYLQLRNATGGVSIIRNDTIQLE